jgi:hypothetical protein
MNKETYPVVIPGLVFLWSQLLGGSQPGVASLPMPVEWVGA